VQGRELAAERTRSAGRALVIEWAYGVAIAICIEDVGLGSDDDCSFNKIGATRYEETIFTDLGYTFAPTHDRRHELARISG
jgi:hypothetical protein